jgi:glycerol-3-phosphate cytidylyltransferase-like family protein
MLIFELFEAKPALKTVVILPGGFHPFHPGHLSLYQSAQKMFPIMLPQTTRVSVRLILQTKQL